MKLSFALPFLVTSLTSGFSPRQLNQRMLLQKSLRNGDSSVCRNTRYLVILHAGKVGIFFGTSTGNTSTIAGYIASEFGDDADEPIEIDEIQGSVAKKFAEYDALVVGTPTWNTGADTERSGTGWDEIYYGELQDLDLAGKKVAVFGLGDQISYSENFADATGELHDVFENLGCKMLGYTSQEGYEHTASKSIRGDKFCGLLCDEINQDDLSEERVKHWVDQLRNEGILDLGTSKTSTTVTIDVNDINGSSTDALEELKRENAALKKMLEENSKMMNSVLQGSETTGGFVPHFNPKTKVTMWTSRDGTKCYYTSGDYQKP